MFKLVIILSVFVFIVAVFVIVITAKDRPASLASKEEKSKSGAINQPSKTSMKSGGYEMAEMSE